MHLMNIHEISVEDKDMDLKMFIHTNKKKIKEKRNAVKNSFIIVGISPALFPDIVREFRESVGSWRKRLYGFIQNDCIVCK